MYIYIYIYIYINMILKLKQNKRYKPLYRSFYRLFENVQQRKKLLRFKNKKWKNLIERLKKIESSFFKRSVMRKNQSNNLNESSVYTRGYKRLQLYKYLMTSAKKINLYYGGLRKKKIKKIVRIAWGKKKIYNYIKPKTEIKASAQIRSFYFLDSMEKRLETILYKALFTNSVKSARQLIFHGHVYVNKQVIKHGSYQLKKNDLIEVASKFKKDILLNLGNSTRMRWSALEHVIINYKTLQILYLGGHFLTSTRSSFLNNFPFPVKIKHIIHFYKYVV